MKIAIDNPIRNISSRISSHRSAWAYLWRELLLAEGHECDVLHDEASWDGYDEIYCYLGMEFTGAPNMFDGLSEKVFERMDRFVKNSGKIPYKIIEAQITDLFLRRMRIRVNNGTTDPRATSQWILDLVNSLTGLPTVTQHDLEPKEALVIGDSHSIAVWRPEAYCKRMDGKTLRGLSKSLPDDAREYTEHNQIKSMTVCAGNIDIRHHLFRHENPREYLEETLERLTETIKRMEIPDVELVYALPIEDESRHLRQSVCLEGSPFTGSRAQRADMVGYFNNRISEIANTNKWRVWEWPQEWYFETELDPKWFFTKMEKPYSVHLSREFYRWKTTISSIPPKIKKVSSSAKVKPPKKPDNYCNTDADKVFG